ncbi:MAG: 23S rRNA (adenine(2503)-C(2))-methyltransferase RlmN [Pseudomonadales bacterium]|nr:23S rRNA (adenine(2503)-C(2))-methyltransferase RlmN [Pseudomonadales bacterium]
MTTGTGTLQVEATAPAPETARVNLLGMPRSALEAFFAELGEKPFRATQLMKWIHHRGVDDFAAMTDLSRKLREQLEARAELAMPEPGPTHVSADGTRKWLFTLADGQRIETVFIPEKDRGTLCISSQVGCALDCSFCATGKQGFNRNLTAAEIVAQVRLAARALADVDFGRPKAITNVVLMGMGEPLLNYDAVLAAISVLLDDLGYGISKRRLTLSTAGVVPAIRRLAGETDVALAISLHAPNDALRDRLVPVNRRYPIAELLDACRAYLATLGDWRAITVEYTLMDGVNDELAHAEELAALLADLKERVKLNLIPFNPFPGSGYRRPSPGRVRAFQSFLLERGFATMLRTTRGDDIDAACGQLAGRFDDRTRRRERYIARLKDHGPITHAPAGAGAAR